MLFAPREVAEAVLCITRSRARAALVFFSIAIALAPNVDAAARDPWGLALEPGSRSHKARARVTPDPVTLYPETRPARPSQWIIESLASDDRGRVRGRVHVGHPPLELRTEERR
jgi:uncharacterized protein (DUF58 family)